MDHHHLQSISPGSIPRSSYKNIRGYQTLIAILEPLSINAASLDNLFSVLGAEAKIDRLFLVLETYLNIVAFTTSILEHDQRWHGVASHLRHAKHVAETILGNREAIGRHLQFLKGKKDEVRNNVFRRMLPDGEIFATLGFLPRDSALIKQHLLLMAQILSVHQLTVQKGVSVSLEKPLSEALKGVRTLADEPHLLAEYPDEACLPGDYSDQLAKIEGHKPHPQLEDIQRYLREALGATRSKNLRELCLLIQEPSVKGNRKKPKIPPRKPTLIEEPSLLNGHADDIPPETTGHVYGFAPLASPFETKDSFWLETEMVAKVRAMQNQLFGFSWETLSPPDIQILLDYIFEVDNQGTEELSVKAQLALMLFTGMNGKRLSTLTNLPDDIDTTLQDVYIPHRGILRLYTPGPELQTDFAGTALIQAAPSQTHMELYLPSLVNSLLRRYLDKSAEATAFGRVFPEEGTAINARCQKAISALRTAHGTRLTLSRIQHHLQWQLARKPGNDLAGASLTLGKEIFLARTRIHYLAAEVETLQGYYTQTCADILREAGYTSEPPDNYPDSSYRCVGTPIRPQLATVQSLVRSLQDRMSKYSKPVTLEQTIIFHNAFLLYTVVLIAYSTGYRANNSPFITQRMYDEISGFGVIADKTSRDQYHARLVWILQTCRRQLKWLRQHMERIFSLAQSPLPAEIDLKSEFFFLSTEGKRLPVTRKAISKQLAQHGFCLPPNVQRHFLKSELQEDGCPAEVIEVFLGHWSIGEESWTEASALWPWDFKSELEKYLDPLFRRTGFTAVAGLRHAPAHVTLPLHLPTASERKKRKKGRPRRGRYYDPAPLTDSPPHNCWVKVLGRLFQDLARKGANPFRPEEVYVLRCVQEILPELYAGQPDFCVDQNLLDKLIKRLKPKPMHPGHWYKRLNYLFRVLESGKRELKWQVEIPPQPVLMAKGYNFARPSLIRNLKTFREAERLFLEDLKQPAPENPELRMAQLLLSAILYGHLHHPTWAQAFLSGLRESVFQHGTLTWVDLWAEPLDNVAPQQRWHLQRNPALYRRWIADPTSQQLLYRWQEKQPAPSESGRALRLETLYEAYQQHLQKTFKKSLPPLKKLLAGAQAYSTLSLPSFLAAYSGNRLSSASLPDPAWLRLLSGKNVPFAPNQGSRRLALINTSSSGDLRSQKKRLSQLRKILSDAKAATASDTATVETIGELLTQKGQEMWSAVELLAEWAMRLLSERVFDRETRQKAPEDFSTVNSYIGAFAEELLAVAGETDLLELDEETFDALFHKVAEEILLSRRKDPSIDPDQVYPRVHWNLERLNQFLQYLEIFQGTPSLRVGLENKHIRLTRGKAVRANMISRQEYESILLRLGWGQQKLTRREKMVLFVAILAYRAGLRLGEIHGLLLGDFIGESRLELLVQPNHIRELKTDFSTRKIPLSVLLAPEELTFIQKFVAFRRTEPGSSPKVPLFTYGPLQKNPVDKAELTASVRAALEEETADGTLVFHSYRHAFASTLLLRLLLRQDIPAPSKPAFLLHDDFHIQQCNRLRTDLLANESLGRKVLYAGAALLGHADTKTEISSYFHLCDWLLWYYSIQKTGLPLLQAEVLAAITGKSRSYGAKLLASDHHPLLTHRHKTADSFVRRRAHPLLADAQTKGTMAPCPVPTQDLPATDEALHTTISKGLPRALKKPRHYAEIQILHYFQTRLKEADAAVRARAPESAATLLDSRKHYDATFVLEDPQKARNALELLGTIGIGTYQMIVQYSPARWALRDDSSETSADWQKALGIIINPTGRPCGRNLDLGTIRIAIQEYPALGYVIRHDKKAANLLGIWLAMIANVKHN